MKQIEIEHNKTNQLVQGYTFTQLSGDVDSEDFKYVYEVKSPSLEDFTLSFDYIGDSIDDSNRDITFVLV